MPKDEKLSALTRSLIIGASISTLALAGCVTQEQAETQLTQVVQTLPRAEAALCSRAGQAKDARTVNAFLRRYPQSRCVVPLLSSMPAATLAALSPRAVAGIPPATRRQLPPRVTASLPQSQRQRQAARPQRQQAQPRQQRQQNRQTNRPAGFAQFY